MLSINKKTADLAFLARELGTHKISERGAYWLKRNTPLFPDRVGVGRIWWPEAARLEDPLDISNGMLALKSSGECDGILSLV